MGQDPYKYFRPEARDLLEQFSRGVLDLENGGDRAAMVQRLLRLAHTLKGAARVVKQTDIANQAHAIEDELSALRDCADKVGRKQVDALLQHLDAINAQLVSLAPAADSAILPGEVEIGEARRTIRLDVAESDAVLDGVAETRVLMRGLRTAVESVEHTIHLADLLVSQCAPSAAEPDRRRPGSHTDQRFAIAEELRRKIGGIERDLGSVADQMDRELLQLRETAERLRLVPAGSLFTPLERTARDTAQALGKRVAFKGTGGDIRLDVQVLETLQGALVQLVRNAVAHGVEPGDVRARTGKPDVATVSVSVFRRDRRVVFSCGDDGCGVDLEAVRQVARQRGLIGNSTQETDADDLMRLLLRGGISTSKTVTEVSGRGIGLDVVREAIGRLGGEVGFRSTAGAGTTFELIIPPTLASMDALIVEAGEGGCAMAIPLDAVRGTRLLSAAEVSPGALGSSILHDEKAIAFVPLTAALDGQRWSARRAWPVVIVAGAEGMVAIGVERLLGTATIVIRPLPRGMTANPVIAAASLDVDGNPQLVLDPDSLVAVARRGNAGEPDARPPKRPVLVVDDSLTTRMLEQSILESAGYDVDLATSGEEALERVRDRHYALMLVDVEMPGMDGFTFIERIRSDPKLCEIPAILVTSLAEPEHRQRGRDVGAQGYMVKSEFDQAELLSIIKPLMA